MSDIFIKALRRGENLVLLTTEYDSTLRRDVARESHFDLTSAGILADEIKRLARE